MKIAFWIQEYSDSLSQFFNDERLRSGINILLNSYFSKTVEVSKEIVRGIVESVKKCEFIKENNSSIIISSSPFDLFKLINENFDLSYGACPMKETVLKNASYAKKMINFYSKELESLMVLQIFKKKKALDVKGK